jgi:uncharacterized protein YcbK (DUF882 family)
MRALPVFLSALALAVAVPLAPTPARADVTHVVRRGHTLESIAHRYHVSEKAIIEANHLKDPGHLKPGQTLIIPVSSPTHRAAAAVEPDAGPRGRGDEDTIHAVRLGEEFHIRVKDTHGHIPPSALKAFERLMRQGDATHPPDPRLVALVGIVSSHFGSKTIEVVSGYRAYTPTQYTPHSNHNYGKALDFRIRGVPNEALRDFCRTLRSAGCGYYPNSAFVHLDVRDTKAYWVDLSHPGEPPKYETAGTGADEGTSDVPDEGPASSGEGTEAPGSNPPPSSPASSAPVGQ